MFDSFADNELAWGPTWSTSLKSLWVGGGEAIGDIAVGAELGEQLGSEPIHPVLLDLCTGMAGGVLAGAQAGDESLDGAPWGPAEGGNGSAAGPSANFEGDLFLPLRYGRVVVRDRMPRRFYCRAKWQSGGLDSETQVFDLDFVDRDGNELGGIREFTVKRAPREALLRGLGGDATRLLYTLGWHEVSPPESSAEAGAAGKANGTWLIAGFDELAASLPGSISFDRTADAEPWKQLIAQAQEDGAPLSGIVWRSTAQPSAEESSAEFTARLETEIGSLLNAVHTRMENEAPKLPGGLWIITERAVATESSEPVDPVQAALWGLGTQRHRRGAGPALQARRPRRFRRGRGLVGGLLGASEAALQEPELALRQGKFLASRLLPWSRSGNLAIPRGSDYVLAPTERGAIDNLHVTKTEVLAPDEGYVQIRVEAAGLNFRDVLNVLGLYPGDPGLIGGDVSGIVTEIGCGVTGFEVGQRVYGIVQGAFASRVNVPAQFLAPVPKG